MVEATISVPGENWSNYQTLYISPYNLPNLPEIVPVKIELSYLPNIIHVIYNWPTCQTFYLSSTTGQPAKHYTCHLQLANLLNILPVINNLLTCQTLYLSSTTGSPAKYYTCHLQLANLPNSIPVIYN